MATGLSDEEYRNNTIKNWKLTWKHIISAIGHELSYERAENIMNEMIENEKYPKLTIDGSPSLTMGHFMDILTNKMKGFIKNERNHIKKLIKSALRYDPSHVSEPWTLCEPDYEKHGYFAYLIQSNLNRAYRVSSSELAQDSEKIHSLIHTKTDKIIKTKFAQKPAFIAIFLKKAHIKVTYFTLSVCKFDLNNSDIWFQGSYNGQKWKNLYKFEQKSTDNEDSHQIVSKNNDFFCYFRLFMKPKVENIKCSLQCIGLQIFGKVVVMDQDVYDVRRAFELGTYQKVYLFRSESLAHLKTFYFQPYYIINDNIFQIFSYIFAISHFIQNHQRSDYSMRLYVKCKRIECLYDEKFVYLYQMGDFAKYLEAKKTIFVKRIVEKNDLMNADKMRKIIQTLMKKMKLSKKNILVFIDRTTCKESDILYLAQYDDDDSINWEELETKNLFLGMIFNILQNVNRAYLTFGVGQYQRFYPEQLTNAIPRLFKKQNTMNDYDYLMKIHDRSFKHGFCLNLEDKTFNKKYQMTTFTTHVSVNYNRSFVKPSEYKCSDENILALDDCEHLKIIICSLTLFKECGYVINDDNVKQFDLQSLIKAYDHIISGHKFCSNQENRQKIQKFVVEQIGACEKKNQCNVLNNHSLRRRERKDNESTNKNEHKVSDLTKEILVGTLNSLYAYLVHTDGELFRLRSNNQNIAILRFVQSMDDKDEDNDEEDEPKLDKINMALIENKINDAMYIKFNQWVKENEFDSDAIDEDVSQSKQCSNLYTYLSTIGMSKYFHLFHHQPKVRDVSDLNFGVSVLQWISYYEKPKFANFKAEILGNSHSTIDEGLYEVYKEECLLKMAAKPWFTLNELMCLKLYTDTTKYQSALRRAHWDREGDDAKKEKLQFYHWAMQLYKCSLYHSMPIPQKHQDDNNVPCTLFHGLNDIFVISRPRPFYNGPISTTLQRSVAHSFTEENGLLWSLNSSYSDRYRQVFGIALDWLSAFKSESEILLINQYLPIKSTQNFEKLVENKINLILGQLIKYKNKITNKRKFYEQIGFVLEPEWLPHVARSHLLYKSCQYKDCTVLYRLVKELKIVQFKRLLTMSSGRFAKHYVLRRNAVILLESDANFECPPNAPLYDVKYELICGDYGRIYTFDKIEDIEFIVPFDENLCECTLYGRSYHGNDTFYIKKYELKPFENEIDYLMNVLMVCKKITNEKCFFEQIGIEISADWIPMIAKHELLDQTVLQRLVDELNVSALSDLMKSDLSVRQIAAEISSVSTLPSVDIFGDEISD